MFPSSFDVDVFPAAQPTSDDCLSNASGRTAGTLRRIGCAGGASPLAKARAEFASALNGVLERQRARNNEACSNASIGRVVGIDERIVRRWRTGDAPMPAAALTLVPSQVFAEVIDFFSASRRQVPRRSPLQLAICGVERRLAGANKMEALRELADARGQIDGLLKKAEGW